MPRGRHWAAGCLGLLVLGWSAAVPAQDPAPRLALPVDCVPGETCWAANYVDLDPGPGAVDAACRPRSYDDHDGTDFALRDLGAMAAGVAVLAAAPGTVRAIRDGMADSAVDDPAAVNGRECGNGVVIDHEGGWQTQYCHLRQGSLLVAEGDRVEAGQPIGQVGLSGLTEFPHLHFTVRHDGETVDPFTGLPASAGCAVEARPLWREAVPYEPFALTDAGFAAGEPDIEAIRAGEAPPAALPRTAPALVLWVDMLGVAAGDRLTLTITGPDGGDFFRDSVPIERTQARRYVYAGRRAPPAGLAPGLYVGRVTLERPDTGEAGILTRTVEVR